MTHFLFQNDQLLANAKYNAWPGEREQSFSFRFGGSTTHPPQKCSGCGKMSQKNKTKQNNKQVLVIDMSYW